MNIQRVDAPEGRYYEASTGERYGSVTGILGKNLGDADWLDAWKARVGEEEAAAVSGRALRRGRALHESLERYVLGYTVKGLMPDTEMSFRTVRELLDENLGAVYGVEIPLISHTLRAGGTADLVARWCRQLSVIDFKTTSGYAQKEESDLEGYLLQATAYSEMLFETYKMDARQIVIILTSGLERPQVVIRDPADYVDRLYEVFMAEQPKR